MTSYNKRPFLKSNPRFKSLSPINISIENGHKKFNLPDLFEYIVHSYITCTRI